MVHKQKKKQPTKNKQKSETNCSSTNEFFAQVNVTSDDIVRLKLTTRKGTRIESVPLKKLEKLANKTHRFWKFEEGWLTLIGLS